MNKVIIVITLAALLGTAIAPAMAQTAGEPDQQTQLADRGDGDGNGGRHHGKDRHGDRHGGGHMRIIDSNNDGVIGEDEAASIAEHMFNRMDANADGVVTETEYTTLPHAHFWSNWLNSAEVAAVEKVRKEKFASLDADKNASMSKPEFFADAKARLAAADTDKDGKVTPWEFRSQN
jgi:opacity protein-like surface antigen